LVEILVVNGLLLSGSAILENGRPGYRARLTERRGSCAVDQAPASRPDRAHGGGEVTDCFVEGTQVLCGALVERRTGGRERDRVGRPVDQLRTEKLLELGDGAANRPLADAQTDRSLRKLFASATAMKIASRS
jgi:hypothetical protein